MILRRYIQLEILQQFLWVTGLLILIYSSNKFVVYLADAVAGKIPSALVFHMLGLKLVSVLPSLLPAAIFLAVILAYSRLIADNEMVIIFSTGTSKLEQLKIISLLMAPICVLIAGITFFLAPWIEVNLEYLKMQAKQNVDITGIAAGQFREFSKEERIVYVESLSEDKTAMENVFLQVRRHGKPGVLKSDRAVFEFDEDSGNHYIKFENGYLYIGIPGETDYKITKYKTYAILLDANKSVSNVGGKLESIPTSVLLASDFFQHEAELQWRLSSVISVLLLSIFAVLLSQLPIGKKRYVLIFISILVYLIYNNLLGISRSLLERDVIPPFVGLWWVHILLIIGILVLYYLPQIKRRLKGKNNFQVLKAD